MHAIEDLNRYQRDFHALHGRFADAIEVINGLRLVVAAPETVALSVQAMRERNGCFKHLNGKRRRRAANLPFDPDIASYKTKTLEEDNQRCQDTLEHLQRHYEEIHNDSFLVVADRSGRDLHRGRARQSAF